MSENLLPNFTFRIAFFLPGGQNMWNLLQKNILLFITFQKINFFLPLFLNTQQIVFHRLTLWKDILIQHVHQH